MVGVITLLDQPRTLDALGRATDALIYFYLTGTTVLAPIYDDAGLTIPAVNPVDLAAGEIFPDIYLDPAVTYRRRILYGDGTIHDVDPLPGASGGSAALISFIQSGANSKTRTVQDKLRETMSIADKEGTPDVALTRAASEARTVWLEKGAVYDFSSIAVIPNNTTIMMNGATIRAIGGYSGTHLITMQGDAEIVGPGTILGTNVPAPSGAYSAGLYAGVGIYITGTGNNGLIDNITFSDFQSGPILHDSATVREGFKVSNCVFLTVQKYTANATNSVVAFHGISRGLQVDCRLQGYNWKGFYVANGDFNQIVRCHSVGGVDGHASHYISGGADNSILDCSHKGTNGVGFGIKCSDTTRPTVRGFKAQDARSALFFQGCEDFVADDIESWRSTISCILIEGSVTYGAATRGILSKVRSRRTVLGSGANDVGVRISASGKLTRNVTGATQATTCVVSTSPVAHGFKEGERVSFSGVVGMTQLNGNTYFVRNPTLTTFELYTATGPLNSTGFGAYSSGGVAACGGEIDRVTVRDSYFENCLWGAHIVNSGAQQTNIRIIDNEFINCGQYGILAFMGSGEISRNIFNMDGAAVEAAVHTERDGVTTTGSLLIDNNTFSGCTADNIEIQGRQAFKSIRVSNNQADGGTVFLNFNCNGDPTDVVNSLEVSGNTALGVTNGGLYTFNGTTATRFKAKDNNFLNVSYAKVSDTYTTLTNVTFVDWRVQTGSVTLAAGTAAATLPLTEPNTSYQITLGGSIGESFFWSAKATGGFTVTSSNAGSTATVNWVVTR